MASLRVITILHWITIPFLLLLAFVFSRTFISLSADLHVAGTCRISRYAEQRLEKEMIIRNTCIMTLTGQDLLWQAVPVWRRWTAAKKKERSVWVKIAWDPLHQKLDWFRRFALTPTTIIFLLLGSQTEVWSARTFASVFCRAVSVFSLWTSKVSSHSIEQNLPFRPRRQSVCVAVEEASAPSGSMADMARRKQQGQGTRRTAEFKPQMIRHVSNSESAPNSFWNSRGGSQAFFRVPQAVFP